MREFRLRIEETSHLEQAIAMKYIVTLLDDKQPKYPTIASQMGDTVKEALDKIMPYLERELHAGGL